MARGIRGRVASALRRCGLLVCGALLGLALGEVGLRASVGGEDVVTRQARGGLAEGGVLYEYDELLGWKGRALGFGTQEGSTFSFSVRLNSAGFREREVPLEKPNGRFRVLVLGDSMTWGLGVEQGQRFSEVLEELLRRQGIDGEVLNFGMTGYGTDQELLLFDTVGVRYRPDLVIVAFYWNDLFENSASAAYGYPKPRFVRGPAGSLELTNVPVPARQRGAAERGEAVDTSARRASSWGGGKAWLEANSRVYRLCAERVRQSLFLYRLSILLGIAGGPKRDPETEEWRLTRQLLEMLRQSVRRTGSEFLVVVIPERRDLETAGYELKRPLIAELTELPATDLFPAMRAAGDADALYFRDDIHLTAAGHRAIGKAIFEHLAAGRVPVPDRAQ